ncbi:MAG: radical SAM protein [Syntrophomonas sp.]
MADVEEPRFTIQWHITERCNCRCRHCYQEDSRAEATAAELDEVRRQVESFLEHRPGMLTVTGGEPLLHPGFYTLLEELNCPFAVLSNGTLIDRETAGRLAQLKPRFIQVSIEGREKTHDDIRGTGTFARAVEGIANLVEAGLRVLISFTAHRENYQELPYVARLGRKLKVGKVWVDRLIPAGAGAELGSLSPMETRDLFMMMDKNRVALDRALQFLAGGQPYRCQAGRNLLAILPGGEVLPCRRLPIVAGNLHVTSLEDIYKGACFEELRQRSCAPCASCLYREICDGGLRCLAYALKGSPFEPDPGCWIADSIARSQVPGENGTSLPAMLGKPGWFKRHWK